MNTGDEAAELWSVRMRASALQDGIEHHLSGAERIIPKEARERAISEMLARADSRTSETIHITCERVPPAQCQRIPCLPVQTVLTKSPDEAGTFAAKILAHAGVAPDVAHTALLSLQHGLGGKGRSLRGASLWDCQTGQRMEPDQERGVRTSHFDYTDPIAAAEILTQAGLPHFRTREALAVATKTLWSGVLAELCWSDEPDYATGYVATPKHGYVRLPGFKPEGACGGRVFFLDMETIDLEKCHNRLEREYALIASPSVICGAVLAEEWQ